MCWCLYPQRPCSLPVFNFKCSVFGTLLSLSKDPTWGRNTQQISGVCSLLSLCGVRQCTEAHRPDTHPRREQAGHSRIKLPWTAFIQNQAPFWPVYEEGWMCLFMLHNFNVIKQSENNNINKLFLFSSFPNTKTLSRNINKQTKRNEIRQNRATISVLHECMYIVHFPIGLCCCTVECLQVNVSMLTC